MKPDVDRPILVLLQPVRPEQPAIVIKIPAEKSGKLPFLTTQPRQRDHAIYALQDAAKHDPVVGAGNGYVSVFDVNGNFVKRFASAGTLNAPWGTVQASASFGRFSNDLLIGNFGDGTINAFDVNDVRGEID